MNVANFMFWEHTYLFWPVLIGIRHNRGEQGKLTTLRQRRNNYFDFSIVPLFVTVLQLEPFALILCA